MNTIREAVHEYVDLRRSLGFKLVDTEQRLLQFATFLEEQQAAHITQELALAWARQPANVQPSKWAELLTNVRAFARYRQAADPRTEIPAPGLLPYRPKRAKPHLYSDEEIQALLKAARNMPYHGKRQALLPWTYYCLIGLLSVSGLRVGEARDLALQDVDLQTGLLTVRAAKHGRTRLVPLHESTCRVLADYTDRRRRHWIGRPVSQNLFLSSTGKPLEASQVKHTFRKLSRHVGLRGPDDRRGPRLHDFRHTLAVRTLENWYREGQDPDRMLPILSTYLGHVRVSDTYLVPRKQPRADERSHETAGAPLGGSLMKGATSSSLLPLMQRFFIQRLIQQHQVSPHTIESYRGSFKLFLRFASKRLGQPPERLHFEQIDAPLITAFLDDLETSRNVSIRTRNLRLTAIHSFFRYAAFELPTHGAQIQWVLAIPGKRFTRKQVGFLNREEVDALLAAPDRGSWSGRRDHAFILTAVQTGLRVSEMTGLKREDLVMGAGAHLRVIGKGRKERSTPLAKPTCGVLKAWLREPQRGNRDVLFPNFRGERLTIHGVQHLLKKHQATAAKKCPSLKDRRVTVHLLRHTAAMDLLQARVDRSIIALWLGHESVETTQFLLELTRFCGHLQTVRRRCSDAENSFTLRAGIPAPDG